MILVLKLRLILLLLNKPLKKKVNEMSRFGCAGQCSSLAGRLGKRRYNIKYNHLMSPFHVHILQILQTRPFSVRSQNLIGIVQIEVMPKLNFKIISEIYSLIKAWQGWQFGPLEKQHVNGRL